MNVMTPPAVDRTPPVFNPLDPAFIADPYPFYHRLRETAPIYKTPMGFWLLSRYEDVAFSLKDRRFGKDFAGNIERRYGPGRMNEPAVANLARTMLVLDPPVLVSRCRRQFRLHPHQRHGELRRSEHLRPSSPENRGTRPPIPSALRPIPAATTASADFSLRFITVALSGTRRDLPR